MVKDAVLEARKLILLHSAETVDEEPPEVNGRGHGSNIDADMVDGYHAEEVVAKAATEAITKVKWAGGGGGGRVDTSFFVKKDEHTKAVHDALGIDADTLEGSSKAQVQDHAPKSHGNEVHSSEFTTLPIVKADADIADAIAKKHSNALDHSNSLDHSNALDHSDVLDHVQGTDADLDSTFEATFEKVANKGAVSGYAPLDADQKVPTANLPSMAPNIKQTEVDFGDTIQDEKEFTVVDAGVGVSSRIIAMLSGEAPTDKDQDETEMDSFNIICEPADGQFNLFMKSLEGSVYGKFKVNYMVGA